MAFKLGNSDCESAELSMVIIRADGSREDLGVVSYYHKNPFKMIWWKIKRLLSFKGR